ncbi:hypothetical protein J4Q44_G00205850 [Coregonus suidteri]|uniref:Uncharacterized protein n=1 Tax=Coregonus suidteri TaxID=861788 RepID=A0AAN8LC45_9TELE
MTDQKLVCKGRHAACLASTTSSRFGPYLERTQNLASTRDRPPEKSAPREKLAIHWDTNSELWS